MISYRKFERASILLAVTLASGTLGSTAAFAQISLSPAPAAGSGNQVCTGATELEVADTEDGCTDGAQRVNMITFESGTTLRTDSGSTAQFNGIANFTNNVQMSGLQAFSGTTAFNSTVSFVGPSVTFESGTSFEGMANFNALVATSGGIGTLTSNTITAATINSAVANASVVNAINVNTETIDIIYELVTAGGAFIDFGGNEVHGVAPGEDPTDAVNVAQLDAATAGLNSNIATLQNTTATHATQIGELETTSAAHTSQIAQHTTQISSLETTAASQATQITAIQAVNTTQSTQISALQAAQDLFEGRIDTLFDLRGRDRRDMKQGVASAMAMAPASMPSAPGRVAYAVNGATFRGEYAVGGSLTYRLNTRAPTAINLGFAYAGNKNNGARVGIAGEF